MLNNNHSATIDKNKHLFLPKINNYNNEKNTSNNWTSSTFYTTNIV